MCQDLLSHPSKRYHPSATIPPLLDIPELFNPDANHSMWMDTSLNDNDEECQPPGYLADPKMQDGILGWLALQRCEEEQPRLLGEMEGLICWMSSQIDMINQALSICQGLFLLSEAMHSPSPLPHRPCPRFSTGDLAPNPSNPWN
jgi:hypothetical protein